MYTTIKIHQINYTNTNTSININKYKYTNLNTQIQKHPLKNINTTDHLPTRTTLSQKRHREVLENVFIKIQLY